jgi:hypothetical protein
MGCTICYNVFAALGIFNVPVLAVHTRFTAHMECSQCGALCAVSPLTARTHRANVFYAAVL